MTGLITLLASGVTCRIPARELMSRVISSHEPSSTTFSEGHFQVILGICALQLAWNFIQVPLQTAGACFGLWGSSRIQELPRA